MVRIQHNAETESESEIEALEGETSDEEDIPVKQRQNPPEPREPLDLSDETASRPTTPEQLDSDEDSAVEDRTNTASPHIVSTVVNIGVTNILNIRFLLDRYGKKQNNGHQRPITSEGLSKFVSELQDKAAPISGTFAGARTPADNWMPLRDNRHMEREAAATEYPNNTFPSMERNKEDDEEDSAKEKSNGVGEKQQLAVAAAEARASLLSSPDLTDCELSDVSDYLLPPDYDSVTMEQRSSTDCPTNTASQIDPTFAGESPPLVAGGFEDPGEAIALPASMNINSRQDYAACLPDDDRLFALEPEAFELAPSTSRVEDIPSPTTERRRIKQENRQRAQHQRSNLPFGGMRERFITVPTEKIGRIVGKSGARIREIENKSGAKVKIEDRKSKNPFTKIILIGTDAQISMATDEIGLIARNFKPAEPGEATTVAVSNFNDSELRQLLLNIKNQVLKGERNSR